MILRDTKHFIVDRTLKIPTSLSLFTGEENHAVLSDVLIARHQEAELDWVQGLSSPDTPCPNMYYT